MTLRRRTRLVLLAVNLLVGGPALVLLVQNFRAETAASDEYYRLTRATHARWREAAARRDAHERNRGSEPDPAFNDRSRELGDAIARAGAETKRLSNAPPRRRSPFVYLAFVYLAVLPTILVTAVTAWRERRAARRARAGLCPACAYDLRATPAPGGALLGQRPECGTPAAALDRPR